MNMYNPPHPGEFIKEVYLYPNNISARDLASHIQVAPSTVSRMLSGTSRVTPDMAVRLSKALGRSPESWLLMQDKYDLGRARKEVRTLNISKLELNPA